MVTQEPREQLVGWHREREVLDRLLETALGGRDDYRDGWNNAFENPAAVPGS